MDPLRAGRRRKRHRGLLPQDPLGPIGHNANWLASKDNDVLMFKQSAKFIQEVKDELERLSTVKITHIQHALDDAIYEGS